MWYMYTMEYHLAIRKGWNNAICSNIDGPRGYPTKWSKPDRERQIPYVITYMRILKKKEKDTRASLAIQQLRLHASNAGGAGSISSQDCTWCGQKIKFNFKEIQINLCTKQK